MKYLTPLGVRRKIKTINRKLLTILKETTAARCRLLEDFYRVQDKCPHEHKMKSTNPNGGSGTVLECIDCERILETT